MISGIGKYLSGLAVFSQALFVTGVMYPPAISAPPADDPSEFFIIASRHKDLILTCAADRPDKFTVISWRRNQTFPLPSGWSYADIPNDGTLPAQQTYAKSIKLETPLTENGPSTFEGSYECVVNSTLGIAVSGPVTVTFADIQNPRATQAQHVTADVGSTVELPCSSTGRLRIYPDIRAVGYSVLWTVEDWNITGVVGRPPKVVTPWTDPRYAINEEGTLYIRDFNTQDETSQSQYYLCFIKNSKAVPSYGLTLGIYTLRSTGAERYPSRVKSVYKTPDLQIPAFSTVYLSCIFEDPYGELGVVSWIGPTKETVSYNDGTLIQLKSITSKHSGDWVCIYHGNMSTEAETVKVTVIDYPLIGDHPDTYSTTGSGSMIDCLLVHNIAAVFKWFFNDQPIQNDSRHHIIHNQNSSYLQITEVTKQDTGVFACSATNQLGTMKKNSRFIVYDRGNVNLTSPNTEQDRVTALNQKIVLNCAFTVDEMATQVMVFFKLQQKADLIDVFTDDPTFGVRSPAIFIENNRTVSLDILASPEINANLYGLSTCIIKYFVFEKQVEDVSNPLMIVADLKFTDVDTENTTLPNSGVPNLFATRATFVERYWWMGVLLFSIAIVAIVLSVNFVYKRRRQHLNDVARRVAVSQPVAHIEGPMNVSPTKSAKQDIAVPPDALKVAPKSKPSNDSTAASYSDAT